MRVLQLLKEITRDAITTNARGGNLINLIYNKSVTAVRYDTRRFKYATQD
jgi:hypothetical protein